MSDALGFAFGDALTAGLSEWKSSLAHKFQQQQAQAAIDEARRRDAIQQQIALVRADAQIHAADASAGARRYAAEASYAGRTEAANRYAGSREYAAELGERGRRYTADQSLQGRKYAADQGLTGRRYAADTGLKGANVRAGATRDAARMGADSRVNAANVGAGASQNRSLMSLFGQMHRPQRPTGALDPEPAPPPKMSEWLKQQGLPDVRPVGMPTAEHHATAANYVKKIRDAQAKGDLEGAAALKKEAAEFMRNVPGVGLRSETPPQDDHDDEDCLDDGDDEDDDTGGTAA